MSWEMSILQSSAGMLANSDHTNDYALMHNISETPSFLEKTLDHINDNTFSKCIDVGIADSLGMLPPWKCQD